MDLLVIGVLICTVFTASTVCYLAGRDAAERKFQAELAGARIAYKRLQRDLEHAREETAMIRRALRDRGTAA
jgi:5-bromo-4-chloroindolyl phosphate hydrolysis protein